MNITKNTEITVFDLVQYAKKYWFWVVTTGAIAGFVTFVNHSYSFKYVASAQFSIAASESNQMQELTEKLGGMGMNYDDGTEQVARKFQQYFASPAKGKKVLQLLKQRNQAHLVKDLQNINLSFPEKVIGVLGLSETLNRQSLAQLIEDVGAKDLLSNWLGESFLETDKALIADGQKLKDDKLMIALINGSLSISGPSENSNLMSVTVSSNGPAAAYVIANLAMYQAVQDVVANNLQEVAQSKKYLAGQIKDTNQRIRIIERQLTRIRRKSTGSDKLKSKVENHLLQLEDQLLVAQSKKSQMDELIAREKRSPAGYRDFRKKSTIDKLEREQLFWKSKIASLKKVIRKVKKKNPLDTNVLISLDIDMQNLERQKDFEYNHLSSMQKMELELNVREVAIKNKVKILDYANEQSVVTNTLPLEGILAAIIMAMTFTIFIFIVKENISPEIKGREDVDQYHFLDFGSVPDFSLLSNLTKLRSRFAKTSKEDIEKSKSPMFIPNNTPQDFVFGQIRSKLMHSIEDSEYELKIVAVTSPRQGEGKSLISGKLAYSIAKANFNVLLIDGDPIRKDLSYNAQMEDHPGLREILTNGDDPEKHIVKSELNENLNLLPAGEGRGSVADILITKECVEFFKYCREKYDIVVIDTPALLIAPDALLLCRMADVTTMVLSGGTSKLRDVHKANSDLRNNGVDTIGCIINRSESVVKYVYAQPKRKKQKKGKLRLIKNEKDPKDPAA